MRRRKPEACPGTSRFEQGEDDPDAAKERDGEVWLGNDYGRPPTPGKIYA